MELNNTTLTTAAAWRVAISLTLADVRTFAQNALTVAKIILVIAYVMTAFVFTLSESEEDILLNALGLAMFFLPVIYYQSRKNVSNNED